MGKAWEHLLNDMDARWMQRGGWCQTTNMCAVNLRANFLPVKLSTCDFVNAWGVA